MSEPAQGSARSTAVCPGRQALTPLLRPTRQPALAPHLKASSSLPPRQPAAKDGAPRNRGQPAADRGDPAQAALIGAARASIAAVPPAWCAAELVGHRLQPAGIEVACQVLPGIRPHRQRRLDTVDAIERHAARNGTLTSPGRGAPHGERAACSLRLVPMHWRQQRDQPPWPAPETRTIIGPLQGRCRAPGEILREGAACLAPSFARASALRGRAEWHSPNAAPASLRSSDGDDIDFIDEPETDEQHPQLAAARRVTLVADSHMTKSRAPRCALIDAIADLVVPHRSH